MVSKKTFADYNITVPSGGGVERYTTCPQCSNGRKKKRDKCLSINVEDEVWFCHHCHWKGNLKNGTGWGEPVWIQDDYKKPKPLVKRDIKDVVYKFFTDRGISRATVDANQITVERVYIPQTEKFEDAITFPYFVKGVHLNNKYRARDKNFRMAAQAELCLYGYDDVKGTDDVVIWVEGEMDKLTLYEAGYKNCVSVPNGAPPPNSKSYSAKFAFLDSASEIIAHRKHILWFDRDAAGLKLELEISRRIGKEHCLRVRMPDDYKDANELHNGLGIETIAKCIENAEPYPVSGIHTADQLHDNLLDLHAGGLKGGYKTGWKGLDYFYTVALGQITVVTGIPNHGKSNFLDAMLANLAKESGLRFGIFSPENQPLERHAANLLEKATHNNFKAMSKDDVSNTNYWVNDHFYWILPDISESWSLKNLLEKAKVLVARYGINGLVLDPWNEIEHARTAAISESDYISKALTQIRQFARLYNVHVWVVAHPTKLTKDHKTGEYPPPTPYDISGSANWRNKADCAITVYRRTPKVGGSEFLVDVFVMKVRFKEVGKVGNVLMRYDPENTCYYEASQFDAD